MTTTPYEHVLHAAEQLTPEEHRRLRSDLTRLDLADGHPSGAAFVDALLASPRFSWTGRNGTGYQRGLRAGRTR